MTSRGELWVEQVVDNIILSLNQKGKEDFDQRKKKKKMKG